MLSQRPRRSATLFDKARDQHEPSVFGWRKTVETIWWVSVFWLALEFVVMVYFFVQWILLTGDPLRYETAIISAFVFSWSLPVGLGVLVAGIVPRTRLSRNKRIGGILLLLLCIGTFLLHDYLQAKYR